jgi:hypothetical protein
MRRFVGCVALARVYRGACAGRNPVGQGCGACHSVGATLFADCLPAHATLPKIQDRCHLVSERM